MRGKIERFIENYSGAFFVGSLISEQVVYLNKKARSLFGVEAGNCDFAQILGVSGDRVKMMMETIVEAGKNSMIYNYLVKKADGEEIVVDIQVGFFDEDCTEVFLELIPQNDTRMQMALHQVNNSHLAEAILNLDDGLSIVHCNQAFHEVFDSNEELRHSHFHNHLINGFLPVVREKLVKNIRSTLAVQKNFSTKIKVVSTAGEEHWYLFELERRSLDGSGEDKAIAFMTNIEKQVELEEEAIVYANFFKAVQNFTAGILYRIDVETMTLHNLTSADEFNKKLNNSTMKVSDYVNAVIEQKIVHPDDADAYIAHATALLEGKNEDLTLRFAFSGDNYERHSLKGYHVYDRNGRLTQIIGYLAKCDAIKENTSFNQYFKVIQELSQDFLFRVEMPSKTLYHHTSGAFSQKVGTVVVNHVEELIKAKIIHPEDCDNYRKEFDEFILSDKQALRIPVRVAFYDNIYKWYNFTYMKILADNGNLKEILGTLVNISQSRSDSLNDYFDALQQVSGESFYIFDIKNKTLVHKGKVAEELEVFEPITNFPEAMYTDVHPDDLQEFKDFIENSLKGECSCLQLRIKMPDTEYQWYEVHSQIIYNDLGEIAEIVGKMNNIQVEKNYLEKATTINSYFDALQVVSGESFYVIDVKTKTLTQTGKVRDELDIVEPIVDFPNSIIDKIHPDNLDEFIQYNENSLNGIPSKIELQILTPRGGYQWFGLNSKALFDENGKVVEVVGNMKNINHIKDMSVQNSTLNKYLTALQAFSKDVLFRIDVPTMTLHHSHLSERMKVIGAAIPNYVERLILEKIVHPDDVHIYRNSALGWFRDENLVYEVRFAINDDFKYEWYCVKAKKIYDDEGNFVEVLGAMINTQKEHNIHHEYNQIDQYFKAMQDLSDDIIFHIDIPSKTFNHTHKNVSGLQFPNSIPNFVENFILSGYIHPDHVNAYREYTDKLFMGLNQEFNVQALVGESVYNWFNIKCKYVYNDMNHPVEIFGKMCNIQEQLDLERKAKYDNLTNALSREAFEERIIHDLAENTNISNALIFIDLDNFKYINDNYGHKYGDFILKKFTKRVQNCIKLTDIIGRVGGDEFVVYLSDVGTPEIALGRANQIIEKMSRPISNGEISHKLGLSIGVAVSPHHGIDLQTLYDNADKAVYISKDRGKNTATLYVETNLI